MLVKILGAALIVIVAILALAATRPSTLHIQRTVLIHAPVEKVFALVNDFHQWPRWAPQDIDDASMRRIYRGAESGAGAISDWDSSGAAGKGTMTLTASDPFKAVTVQADWQKPFVIRNVNQFIFGLESGGATRVTWTMDGANIYPMKVMGVFVNMDRVMGGHFETGLAHLKAVAEQ